MTNEEIVRAYVQALNAGDWAAMEPLFTPDATIRGVLGWGGLDVVLPVWRELHEGMSMHLEIEELVAAGDTVVARFRESGRRPCRRPLPAPRFRGASTFPRATRATPAAPRRARPSRALPGLSRQA